MAKNELVSLALLTISPMHTYAINSVVEEMGMEHWAQISRASLYAALGRLEKRGAVAVHSEKVDNMPERKVFTITAEGEAMLREELREALSTVCKTDTTLFHLGVNFFFGVPAEEGVAWVRERTALLEEGLAHLKQESAQMAQIKCESAAITIRAALKIVEAELEASREFTALITERPNYYAEELQQWKAMLKNGSTGKQNNSSVQKEMNL